MPLPLILGVGAAAIIGLAGVGTCINGAKKIKDANDTLQSTQRRHENNISRFESSIETTSKQMEKLGNFELEILHSFEDFSILIEKIQNKPEFKEVDIDGVKLPEYDGEKIKEVSVGASTLLAGASSAFVGASVGSAFSTSAVAAASGSGIIGATILGPSTLGIGLLAGGLIFNKIGKKLSGKADEAYKQMRTAEEKIDKTCEYLNELRTLATDYYSVLSKVNNLYKHKLQILKFIVNTEKKTDWNKFTDTEKTEMQNLILLVSLLFKMCQVSLVVKCEKDSEINKVNKYETEMMIKDSQIIISKIY